MSGPPTTVALRAFVPEDCARLLSWIDSEDAMYQWSGARSFTWPLDQGQLLRDLAAAGPAELMFAATDAAGEMVGHVRLEVNRHHRLGHIGRVAVAPGQRGRGLGTALMRELARHAFDDLGIHRLQLGVYTFNTAAIACYRAVGFAVEGRAPDSTLGSNGYWDGLTMALLEQDFRHPPEYGHGIRIAGPRDTERIAELLSALGHPQERDQTAERLRAWSASPEGTVLVAESDGDVSGVVALQRVLYLERPGAFARVVALSVSAEHRRADVGRRLMGGVERWASQHGCDAVEVTSLRRREEAQGFYVALGYEDRSGVSARFRKVVPEA